MDCSVSSALHLIECKAKALPRGSYPQQQKPSHHSKIGARIPEPQAGYRFKFFLQPDGAVVILPKIRTARLKGSVPKLDRVISIEEMNTAIEAGATERFRR